MINFGAGILFVFIVFGIFLFGFGFKKTTFDDDILKNRSIYIKDLEYKCKEVK